MMFDVIVREGFTEENKDIWSTHRVHDSRISSFCRAVQDEGLYVYSVIPLKRMFRTYERVDREHDNREEETTP